MAKMMVNAESTARSGVGFTTVPKPPGKKLMANATKGEMSRLAMMLYPSTSIRSNPPCGYNDIIMQYPGRKAMRIVLKAILKVRHGNFKLRGESVVRSASSTQKRTRNNVRLRLQVIPHHFMHTGTHSHSTSILPTIPRSGTRTSNHLRESDHSL